jgi:hypothetical protein
MSGGPPACQNGRLVYLEGIHGVIFKFGSYIFRSIIGKIVFDIILRFL